jgi:hypothetical protein
MAIDHRIQIDGRMRFRGGKLIKVSDYTNGGGVTFMNKNTYM